MTLQGRVEGLEEVASKEGFEFPDKGEWSESKEKGVSSGEGAVEWTASALEESGLEVHYVEHAGRGDRTVLVAPSEFVDGETPLIVSLHGFGGNSYFQSAFVPLHERVNSRGFGLLLPNGSPDAEGSQFWNPTDECCDGGKSGLDDVAVSDGIGGGGAEGAGLRGGVHLRVFQRGVHGAPHGLQGAARPSGGGEPGGDELR